MPIPGIIASAANVDTVPTFAAQTFTASGTFTVPSGVTSISAVCVGGAASGVGSDSVANGGKSGSLRYSSSISVTPGESLTITVGAGGASGRSSNAGASSIIARSETNLLVAAGGTGRVSTTSPESSTIGGSIGGGTGGSGGFADPTNAGGGGGAGGYSGNGGKGSDGDTASQASGNGGGGAGGVRSTGLAATGGGVGIWGEGASGAGDVGQDLTGGSAGVRSRSTTGHIALFGAGGGGNDSSTANSGAGAQGAVRIVWGTNSPAYPSTNLVKDPEVVGFVTGTGTLAVSATVDISSIGVQAGDVIFIAVGNGVTANQRFSGTTLIAQNTGNTPLSTEFLFATSALTSLTVSSEISSNQTYAIVAFRNVYSNSTSTRNFDPFPGSFATNSNSTPQLGAAMTPIMIGVKKVLLVNATAIENQQVATAVTPPSGWTKVVADESSAGSDNGTLVISYRIPADTTEVSVASFSGTANSNWRSQTSRFVPGEYTTT
jgi:hypothetical protein